MSSEEDVNFIENIIRNDDLDFGEVMSVSYVQGAERVGLEHAEKVVFKLRALLNEARARGKIYYAWLDPQAGQIRASLGRDANIQKNFGAKTVVRTDFEAMLNDIHSTASLFERTGVVQVYVGTEPK